MPAEIYVPLLFRFPQSRYYKNKIGKSWLWANKQNPAGGFGSVQSAPPLERHIFLYPYQGAIFAPQPTEEKMGRANIVCKETLNICIMRVYWKWNNKKSKGAHDSRKNNKEDSRSRARSYFLVCALYYSAEREKNEERANDAAVTKKINAAVCKCARIWDGADDDRLERMTYWAT